MTRNFKAVTPPNWAIFLYATVRVSQEI